MRILQVIEFFSPKMGGSAQVAYQTARHLARRGHEVTVWSSDFGIEEAEFRDGSFNCVLFNCAFARWGFYLTPGLISHTRRHLPEFDIIHLHNVRTFQNAVVSHYARKNGMPYVISAHGSLPRLVERKSAKRAYDLLFGKRLVRGARRMIAVSPVEADQFAQAGIPEEKSALVPNGLDLDEFARLPEPGLFRQKFGISDDVFLVLFLGRIHRIKDIDHLIAAFKQVSEKIADARLIIAGPDDGDLSRLQGLAHQLELDAVTFVGPIYGQDKLAALVDADVMVSPGRYEIFGLVPFEALFCGTPVIVTKDSATTWYLNEDNSAFIVPAGDTEQLAGKMIEISANRSSQQPRGIEAQNEIRKRLDWNRIAADLETLYLSQTSPQVRPLFASN